MDEKYEDISLAMNLKPTKPGKKVKAGNENSVLSSVLKSCALNSRWVLWSNTVFFLGNICYIVLDFMELRTAQVEEGIIQEKGDEWFLDSDLKTQLNFAGALFFLANPITDFMGSWAEDKVLEIHEKFNEMDSKSFDDTDDVEEEMNLINYDKIVAQVFFLGSLIYILLAYIDWKDPESTIYEPIDIFASHLFVIDSLIGLIGWQVNRNENKGTIQERMLLVTDPYKLDWSGYGDWSFFIGSIIDAGISYTETWPLTVQAKLGLFSDFLWTINAILYTIGYIYGQDVRRRFASKYYTSLHLLSNENIEDKKFSSFTVELGSTSIHIP